MAKRIAFYVMCTLLVLVVILTGIVIRRVSRIILWSAPQDPISTNTPTAPTAPQATDPTVITEPTDPSHVHTFELTNSIKATCEGYGWNIYTCTECGYVDMPLDERQEPLGHDNGEGEATPATCTEAGYITYTCKRCFRSNTVTQGSPLGHSFTAQIDVPPTCLEDGYTIIHCSREGCQEILETVQNEGTATGHTYGAWTYGLGGSAKPLCCVCFADWSGISNSQPGVYAIVSHSRRYLQHPNEGQVSFYEILIGIPNDPDASTYLYSIYDYLDNGTLVFYYDAQQGLVVRYLDQYDQLIQISTNSALSESITVRPSEAPEDPTEEPTTTPPTEPVEIPTEPAEQPTEPVEEPTEPTQEPPTDPTEPVEEPTEPVEPTEDATEAA